MLRYLVDLAVMRGIGPSSRFAVPERAQRRDEGRPATARLFPWGILLVNVSGSFVLGLVTAALPEGAFIVGAGLLGGYTTFSTAMLDTVVLWRDGARRASAFNAVGMLLLGLLAAGAGLALGATLR